MDKIDIRLVWTKFEDSHFSSLSHLFSLAQYEYLIVTVVFPCTHLFHHTLLIYSFEAISAFSKILRCTQTKLSDFSVSEASCSLLLPLSWIMLLKAFMKYLHCFLLQISNHGYATMKKELMFILWHISSKTRQQQWSVENIYIQNTFHSVFWFVNC